MVPDPVLPVPVAVTVPVVPEPVVPAGFGGVGAMAVVMAGDWTVGLAVFVGVGPVMGAPRRGCRREGRTAGLQPE